MHAGRLRLPKRPGVLPQLQVPVHVPRRAGGLRAALQPGRDAARTGLPRAKEGPGAGRVLREVGVRAPDRGQRLGLGQPGRLRHGR